MNSSEKTKYRNTKKWKEFRKFILDKYDYTCYICKIRKPGKKSRYLQIHHLDEHAYGKETEDDIELLCSDDHKLVEKLLRRKEFDIDKFCMRLKEVYLNSKSHQD